MFPKQVKRISQKQENKSAKVLGTRTTPGSGNKWYAKGDSGNSNILVENKFTFKKSYSVKLETLKRLESQAGIKMPVFELQFKPDDDTYIILKREDFLEIWKN